MVNLDYTYLLQFRKIVNFSGWLFGLTTEVPEKQVTNDANDLNYGFSREEKQKILKLK